MAVRKAWDSLSPSYRKRLERNGIDREMHDTGASLVRARGHFESPKTNPVRNRVQRRRSVIWNKYRNRAKKLAAYEYIRSAYLFDPYHLFSPIVLRRTVEHYEKLERRWKRSGKGTTQAEFDRWYRDMAEEFRRSGEFLYPELPLFYHGREGSKKR